MKLHLLKTWPEFFRAIQEEEKLFEIRKDDRDFAVGDILRLREWNPEIEDYIGTELDVKVTYILRGARDFGLMDGYCIMCITKDTGIGHVCRRWCSQFPRNCRGVREPCDCDDFRGVA